MINSSFIRVEKKASRPEYTAAPPRDEPRKKVRPPSSGPKLDGSK